MGRPLRSPVPLSFWAQRRISHSPPASALRRRGPANRVRAKDMQSVAWNRRGRESYSRGIASRAVAWDKFCTAVDGRGFASEEHSFGLEVHSIGKAAYCIGMVMLWNRRVRGGGVEIQRSGCAMHWQGEAWQSIGNAQRSCVRPFMPHALPSRKGTAQNSRGMASRSAAKEMHRGAVA